MTVPVEILFHLPLLQSLPHVTLSELARQSAVKAFSKREVVLSKGGRPLHLCFLVEGRLQGVDFTMDGREVGTYFTDPGGFFGELGIMDGGPHPETVLAIAKSQVLFVPRNLIRPLVVGMPSMAESMTMMLALKLRQSTAQRRILGLSNPLQKVCAQLFVMADLNRLNKAPAATAEMPIRNMPTHQELAIMINASRETVTRAFQLLLSKGVVVRVGNDLLIKDARKMQGLAEGQGDTL